MFLDLLFVIILALAIFKGYQRGLIVGIFSFVAVIIGLVAGYIGDTIKVSNEWLPVISFAVVFILVALLIRLGANMIQKTVEISMLGWVNRLGGILLYIAIYGMVYSVVLFYAEQLKLLQADTIEKSATWSYVQPWGPKIINGFASVVPVFKGMFTELESFFDGVAQKMAQ